MCADEDSGQQRTGWEEEVTMETTNRVRGGRARPLPPLGTTFTACHKGKRYAATIVVAPELTSGRGVRTGRRVFASLSAAGTAIIGYTVNGWLFWRFVEDTGIQWVVRGRPSLPMTTRANRSGSSATSLKPMRAPQS